MPDHGEWHGESLCKLIRKLLDAGHEVYSECMWPNLEFIELPPGQILGKIKGKLGISLFLETKSNDSFLLKPDLVIVENNYIKHIIQIEESKTPVEIAGIIAVTRMAILCNIKLGKKDYGPFPIQGAVLHIAFKKWLNENTQTVVKNIISEKGNLSEIKLSKFDEFIENVDKYIN